jgi:hypothetical protein
MELDVTHMVKASDEMPMLSGSIAELGQNAGSFTWNNSVEYGRHNPLLSDETALDAARDFFKGFGAWTDDEIAGWSNADLQGLVCQFVAGDIREMESADSYEEYQEGAERGTYSGRLYKGDDGSWYFYLGD